MAFVYKRVIRGMKKRRKVKGNYKGYTKAVIPDKSRK